MPVKLKFNPISGQFDMVSEEDLSGYVPYSGATTDVNLGTKLLTAGRLSLPNSTLLDKYAWEDGGAAVLITAFSPFDKWQAALRGSLNNTYWTGDRSQALIGLDFTTMNGAAHKANAYGVLVTHKSEGNSAGGNVFGLETDLTFGDYTGQTLDNYYGHYFNMYRNAGVGAVAITNYYGFYMPTISATGVTITNKYGIYIDDSGAANYIAGTLQVVGAITGANVTSGSNPGHTHTVSAVSDIDTQIKRLSFLTS